MALHVTFEGSNTQKNLKINPLLEVACFNIESAIVAQRAGADRIELCDDYISGGITPSLETIKKAREKISIPLFVMIRPRSGNFIYSDSEFEKMKGVVAFCRKNKLDGIVFGILTNENRVDRNLCAELIELAKPMKATMHRAFDATINALQSLEDAIDCDFERILTSGQKESALKGASLISSLIKKAGDKITIMPGGSVRADNVAELKYKTGAIEFHSSAINPRTMLADEHEIIRMKKYLAG